MLRIAVPVVLTLIATALSFSPWFAGRPMVWIVFALSQVPAAAMALVQMRRDDELRDKLQPRWGDISLAMVAAVVMVGAAWGVRAAILPAGTQTEVWLMRVYFQAGEPEFLQTYWYVPLAGIVVIAALTELGWRGQVLPALEERVGTRLAWPLAGLLYGVSFGPMLVWLWGEAGVGLLVPAAALLGGLVWSFLAARTGRLVPSILAHALFLWFVIVQFRLPVLDGR